jgi:hypothetical protein
MSRTVTIELPEEIYQVFQTKAATEFTDASPAMVGLLVKRLAIQEAVSSPDATVNIVPLAAAIVKAQNTPPTKTQETVKAAKEVSEKVKTEAKKPSKLQLPKKLHNGKVTTQWMILKAIIDSAFRRGKWESFTIRDLAAISKVNEKSIASAVGALMLYGWIADRGLVDGGPAKLYSLTVGGTVFIKEEQELLFNEGMLESAGHPPLEYQNSTNIVQMFDDK